MWEKTGSWDMDQNTFDQSNCGILQNVKSQGKSEGSSCMVSVSLPLVLGDTTSKFLKYFMEEKSFENMGGGETWIGEGAKKE